MSVAQRGSGADSTGAPCVYFYRAFGRLDARQCVWKAAVTVFRRMFVPHADARPVVFRLC